MLCSQVLKFTKNCFRFLKGDALRTTAPNEITIPIRPTTKTVIAPEPLIERYDRHFRVKFYVFVLNDFRRHKNQFP